MTRAWVVCGLAGCAGDGDWVVSTWGEEYIEQQIPAEVFADGCSVQYDEFLVSFAARELVDGNGDTVGEIAPAEGYDLTVPGPTAMGTALVPADHYSDVRVTVGPDADGVAVLADGTLTCAGGAAHFRWTFDETTVYECEPSDLTIPAGGSDDTQLTVHGDHLWYDGLENPDAEVRGEAVLAADADVDGEITLAELEAVSIPALGYEVGQFSDVLTLRAFVAHLSRTVLHIDGEGECRVAF